ncbi:MAG: sulfurtransferase complex subunit TusC [Gammaproteobacteria bacterium]
MKHYLFVMRRMPHLSLRVQETLDQILTAAAFDQDVTLLFADDGVFQLKKRQNPERMATKNTAAMFLALEMYEVNKVYVEAESLLERGLTAEDLLLPVQLISRSDIHHLIERHQVVIPG